MVPRCPGRCPSSKEMLLTGRSDAIPDTGLLEVLVGEDGARGLAQLLEPVGVSQGLWRLSPEDLVSLGGVGPAAAARLLACVEMSRRARVSAPGSSRTISNADDVVAVCGPQMHGLQKEHFWSLALNTKNRLLRIFEVSVGSLNASIVHPRELFKDVVKVSSASVIVVHNHPSGDPTPSGADIQLTRRLVKAGDVLGIDVLDHVVIGESGAFASLRDMGLM